MSSCVCVCVCVTQLSCKKNCKFKMSFFYGLKQAVFLETGKRLIVLVYECLRGPFMVLLLRRNLVKEKEGVLRRRIYRKYTSCKWLKDAGLEFPRGRVFKHITWSSWPMASRD